MQPQMLILLQKKILLVTHYIYTSIPFTSNIHTSRSCRISLESSSFIRLVLFDKAGYASAEHSSIAWCSAFNLHRLCRSHIWGRCSGARTGSHRCESIDGCRWSRDWIGFCGGWWCGFVIVMERVISITWLSNIGYLAKYHVILF